MFKIIGTACITLLFCAQAAAQQYRPVLLLKDHNSEHLSEYYTYWLQPFSGPASVALADSMYQKGLFKHWQWHKSLSLGDARMRLWVRVAIANQSPLNNHFVFSIHDFLDSAKLFKQAGTGFAQISAGSYWVIAPNRTFPARPLCLPFVLPYGERSVLYLCVDQHNNNLYFPLKIRNVVDFMQEEQNFLVDNYYLWLVGLYVFTIIFNLVLYCFIHDKIYLWYFLYVLLNTVFILMEDSIDGLLLPQWFYTFIWHAGQYTFLMLSTATGIKIMQTFTEQAASQPILKRVGDRLVQSVFLFALLIFISQNYLGQSIAVALIYVTKTLRDVLILTCLLFIVWCLAVDITRKKRMAYYYATTYVFFLFSCTMFMLNHLGVTSINLLQPNILAWGLCFEILAISILLTFRIRFMVQQSGRYEMDKLDIEKKHVQNLLEAQETERKRIAEDLHDDVGSTLGALQLHISNLPEKLQDNEPLHYYFTKAQSLALKATTDIRDISHNLLPKHFGELGLSRVLEKRVDELNATQQTRFRFITNVNEEMLTDIYAVTIYRIINELMVNIIKHAQASYAVIQLIMNDDEINIFTEDDGIGIKNAADKKGIGMKNLASRVGFLQGTLHIESNSKGSTIIISIPKKT